MKKLAMFDVILIGVIVILAMLFFSEFAQASLIECNYNKNLRIDICQVDEDVYQFAHREYALGRSYQSRAEQYRKDVAGEVGRAHELQVEAKKVEVLGRLAQLSASHVVAKSSSSNKTTVEVTNTNTGN